MPIERDQAVCLRQIDYSETSQVIIFFAHRSGQLRLMAKGTKRPKSKSGGAIDLLDVGELAFAPPRSGQLGTLTEWRQTDYFSHLRKDLGAQHTALYLAEGTTLLTEPLDPHPSLYQVWLSVLPALAEPARWPAVLAWGQWQLLRAVGLAPQLQTCAQCHLGLGDPEHLFFSAGAGGVVCRDCETGITEKRRLPRALHGALQGLAAAPGPVLCLTDTTAPIQLLDYCLSYQIGRPLKMAQCTIPQG